MSCWKKRRIRTIMGLWQLHLIDWCTATNWWLPCPVLTWIISRMKKIKAFKHTSHSREHVVWSFSHMGGCCARECWNILPCVCVWRCTGVSVNILVHYVWLPLRFLSEHCVSLLDFTHWLFYKNLQFSLHALNSFCLGGMNPGKTAKQVSWEWMITEAYNAQLQLIIRHIKQEWQEEWFQYFPFCFEMSPKH